MNTQGKGMVERQKLNFIVPFNQTHKHGYTVPQARTRAGACCLKTVSSIILTFCDETCLQETEGTSRISYLSIVLLQILMKNTLIEHTNITKLTNTLCTNWSFLLHNLLAIQ